MWVLSFTDTTLLHFKDIIIFFSRILIIQENAMLALKCILTNLRKSNNDAEEGEGGGGGRVSYEKEKDKYAACYCQAPLASLSQVVIVL